MFLNIILGSCRLRLWLFFFMLGWAKLAQRCPPLLGIWTSPGCRGAGRAGSKCRPVFRMEGKLPSQSQGIPFLLIRLCGSSQGSEARPKRLNAASASYALPRSLPGAPCLLCAPPCPAWPALRSACAVHQDLLAACKRMLAPDSIKAAASSRTRSTCS